MRTEVIAIVLGASLAAAQCSVTTGVKTTFYGVPDNDPAGSDATAFSCNARGFHAGGSGTFDDPMTFASKVGSDYAQCEIIYAPYLKKYLQSQDTCAGCNTGEWTDVFTGNSVDGGSAQISCEDQLTPSNTQSVIRNPPSNLEVDTTPLWNNGQCNTGNVYPSYDANALCSGSSGSSSGGSSSVCQTGCTWAGHCIGCPCATFDDCSDDFVCTNGLCASA
ncbi:hypothetical protein GGR50DRAFT_691404 [Xylaria sp. CBS 124048]|nr:hypothetical protein GGR50DRAFT_691404 [Xylaria sp. CBS 124048]